MIRSYIIKKAFFSSSAGAVAASFGGHGVILGGSDLFTPIPMTGNGALTESAETTTDGTIWSYSASFPLCGDMVLPFDPVVLLLVLADGSGVVLGVSPANLRLSVAKECPENVADIVPPRAATDWKSIDRAPGVIGGIPSGLID